MSTRKRNANGTRKSSDRKEYDTDMLVTCVAPTFVDKSETNACVHGESVCISGPATTCRYWQFDPPRVASTAPVTSRILTQQLVSAVKLAVGESLSGILGIVHLIQSFLLLDKQPLPMRLPTSLCYRWMYDEPDGTMSHTTLADPRQKIMNVAELSRSLDTVSTHLQPGTLVSFVAGPGVAADAAAGIVVSFHADVSGDPLRHVVGFQFPYQKFHSSITCFGHDLVFLTRTSAPLVSDIFQHEDYSRQPWNPVTDQPILYETLYASIGRLLQCAGFQIGRFAHSQPSSRLPPFIWDFFHKQ